MRPNADIPRSLNADAKEYAAATGQNLSDAWQDIIEAGLRSLRPFGTDAVELERPDHLSTEAGSARDLPRGFYCPLPDGLPRSFRTGAPVYAATLITSRDLYLDDFASTVAAPLVDAFGDDVLTTPSFGLVNGEEYLFGRGLRDLYFTLERLIREDGVRGEDLFLPGALVHAFDDFLLALTLREVIPGDRYKDVRGLSMWVLSPGIPYSNSSLDALADSLGVQPFFREVRRASAEIATRRHSDRTLEDPAPSRFTRGAALATNPLRTPDDVADFLEAEEPAGTWFAGLDRIPISVTGGSAFLLDDDAELSLTGLELLTVDDLRMFRVEGE